MVKVPGPQAAIPDAVGLLVGAAMLALGLLVWIVILRALW
jgi:hypothetical protein